MTNILRIPYSLIKPVYRKTSFHKSVIEEVEDEELRDAFEHCRQITRDFAKTFYLATRFLPNEKQRGIFAIYGICRYLDNLVDDAEDLVLSKQISILEVDEKLQEWKSCLEDVFAGKSCNDPILTAFAEVLNRYNISIELPLLLMEGVRQDLTKDRYNNFDELYDYSYKVASVVGLMTSEVFGYSQPEALEHAVDLGIAMQLTNILRDVGEDIGRGRIYLPQDELALFNLTEDDILNRRKSEDFVKFMNFQIKRARKYYESADKGITMLNKDSRLPVYLARYNYSRILDKIEENDYNVFDQRAFLNSTEKLSILPRILYQIRSAR